MIDINKKTKTINSPIKQTKLINNSNQHKLKMINLIDTDYDHGMIADKCSNSHLMFMVVFVCVFSK